MHEITARMRDLSFHVHAVKEFMHEQILKTCQFRHGKGLLRLGPHRPAHQGYGIAHKDSLILKGFRHPLKSALHGKTVSAPEGEKLADFRCGALHFRARLIVHPFLKRSLSGLNSLTYAQEKRRNSSHN